MRQILLAFARHHCRPLENLIEPDQVERTRAYQAGHTVSTEQSHYGVSDQIWNTPVAEEIVPIFLEYSTDMQRTLHEMPGMAYHCLSMADFVLTYVPCFLRW